MSATPYNWYRPGHPEAIGHGSQSRVAESQRGSLGGQGSSEAAEAAFYERGMLETKTGLAEEVAGVSRDNCAET